MKIKGAFLTSKLGRRFFFLFVSCALIPIIILAFITLTQVKSHLQNQGRRQLQQSTKAIGMSLYERMILLNSDIKQLCSLLKKTPARRIKLSPGLSDRFDELVYFKNNGQIVSLLSSKGKKTKIPSQKDLKPKSSKTKLHLQPNSGNLFRVYMSRHIPEEETEKGFITGKINTEYLWKVGSSNTLPPNTELCVLDQDRNIIINSLQNPETMLRQLPEQVQDDNTRLFRWSGHNVEYIANYWPIFMKSRFSSQEWIVVLNKSRADLFAPIIGFQKTFVLVFLLALLSVILLSMINIRRILDPLEKIKSGIKKISSQDFTTKVDVDSKDEFAEVATTFNDMTDQLDEQFRTIKNMSQIDKAILSSLEPDNIINTFLTGLEELLSSDVISVKIFDKEKPSKAVSYYSILKVPQERGKEIIDFPWEQFSKDLSSSTPLLLDRQEKIPESLYPESTQELEFCYLIPVFLNGYLVSIISLGYSQKHSSMEKDLTKAQQLTDQMAIALANSSLVQDLDNLHWATVRALAKTVDAKSSWTAGHSERVCALAIDTALNLNLDHKAINNLRQGALLHDIGKVGIPNAILDKPDKLTDQEFDLIKNHPRLGEQILEPIKEYSHALPIVLQHHENYDGSGYPDGVAGKDIAYLARILAVADVFDAMTSDRPYRAGWPYEQVIRFISDKSGSKFDPDIAQVFIQTVENKSYGQLENIEEELNGVRSDKIDIIQGYSV